MDVQDGFNLYRLVARRDPTAATAMVLTSLSYMPVWVAGTPEQRQHFADVIRGGGKLAWGLSERRHGSDVLANDTTARRTEGGWLLDGEKWTIGNATVADVVMVFARTSDKGDPAAIRSSPSRSPRSPPSSSSTCPTSPCTACAGWT